jgi:hypothetical protein
MIPPFIFLITEIISKHFSNSFICVFLHIAAPRKLISAFSIRLIFPFVNVQNTDPYNMIIVRILVKLAFGISIIMNNLQFYRTVEIYLL